MSIKKIKLFFPSLSLMYFIASICLCSAMFNDFLITCLFFLKQRYITLRDDRNKLVLNSSFTRFELNCNIMIVSSLINNIMLLTHLCYFLSLIFFYSFDSMVEN